MAGKIVADIIESASSQISLNVGNTTILTASSTGLTLIPTTNVNVNLTNSIVTLTAGSVTSPGLTFSGNISTGLYLPAANTVSITTAASERIRVGSSGQIGIGGSNYGTTGQVLTSNGSSAAPGWSNITQIQSITATVASNILTITTPALVLDFRSTTAATGTVTTVAGTPATLSVPANQSYGIATTTVTNRYAVLCFNNAGTLALALTPLQGGVQLDETNFLSPTSTVTNTITTIYSTLTASNLAYRVIGFIDIVYVNGTGYSNAPTLVQGYGGQAIDSLGSLGYSQTWQAVTRAAGTTYYNTTGRPIVFRFAISTSGAGQVACTLNIGGTSFSENFYNNSAGYTWANSYIIPANAAYSFTIGGGAAGSTAGQAYELR